MHHRNAATNACRYRLLQSDGGTPQPGIEMWNTVIPSNVIQAYATDLQGNVIWSYLYQGSTVDLIQGIQLLPNGNMLMLISYLSSTTVNGTLGLVNDVREVDLAGNMVRDITMDTLNQKLAASGLPRRGRQCLQVQEFSSRRDGVAQRALGDAGHV